METSRSDRSQSDPVAAFNFLASLIIAVLASARHSLTFAD